MADSRAKHTEARLLRLPERLAQVQSDFDGVEKRDVVQGLLDYISLGREYSDRLADLYIVCPLKPFGENFDPQALRALISAN